MQIAQHIGCTEFPCEDILKNTYLLPRAEIDPEKIRMLMISEVPPPDSNEDFYAPGEPFYIQTTLQAFQDAGQSVNSISDILNLGVYITTAVKCGKTAYAISSATIRECSFILEKEIRLFPNIKAIILNGDVAIKSLNMISKRASGARVIPTGSTYKIRSNEFFWNDIRVFPSYILTGKNLLIEKSKRKMIAEDIKAAFEWMG